MVISHVKNVLKSSNDTLLASNTTSRTLRSIRNRHDTRQNGNILNINRPSHGEILS